MEKLIWRNLIRKNIRNGRWNKQKKKSQSVRRETNCLRVKKEKDIKAAINCFAGFVILSIKSTTSTCAPIAKKS